MSRWAPELKGDLEVILLKALRKDPQERYATAEQFAEDLEAFLESRPVRARSGNRWYRTGDIVSPRIEATEPLSIELSEFFSAIVNRTPLVSSPEMGLDVIRMMEAVDSSLASGGHPVSLDGES